MFLTFRADLDPIYYCELLKTCPIKDDGDATINSLTVVPNQVPRGLILYVVKFCHNGVLLIGSTFAIKFTFTTQKGTGTGEIDIIIHTQDGVPLGKSFNKHQQCVFISLLSGENLLIEPLQPGTYNSTASVDAKPDPNCDPTQNICENWSPGNYSVEIGEFYMQLCVLVHVTLYDFS